MHNVFMRESDVRSEILRASRKARQLGLTQEQIANVTGHSQSQISRVFSGQTARRSRVTRDICNYVFFKSTSNHRETVVQNQEMIDALVEVWDGSDEHATALACVIRSLGTLRAPSGK